MNTEIIIAHPDHALAIFRSLVSVHEECPSTECRVLVREDRSVPYAFPNCPDRVPCVVVNPIGGAMLASYDRAALDDGILPKIKENP